MSTTPINDDTLDELPPNVTNQFQQECEKRGEDPGAVLERLLLDYIREDDIESKITEIHATVVEEDTPVLVDEPAGPDVELLRDYDPDGEGRLTKAALKQLTDTDGSIAINPVHVDPDTLPQDTQIKRELIKAIACHEYAVVKKSDVNAIAKDLLDIGERYRWRQYIDPIWSEMTVLNESNVTATFISDVEAALAWMDEELAERGAAAESEIYWLGSELHHSEREVSDEALNKRLNQVSLNVDGLHSPQ